MSEHLISGPTGTASDRTCRIPAVLVAVAAVLLASACGGAGSVAGGASGNTGNTGPGTSTTTTSPGGRIATPSGTVSPRTPSPGTATTSTRAGYLRLWPFADDEEAAVWQREYRTGGHQPWHLDPGSTALSFTWGALGYKEIDRVTSTSVHGSDALIGVGMRRPDGSFATVAQVHLIRLGTGDLAPWEVVGTHDTTLSLTTPRYGSTAHSPVVVGGRITGVDESLRIRILDGSSALGTAGPIPAGGQNTPWRATLSFTGGHGHVRIICVSTGGHLFSVERFAITGVLVG